MDVTMIGLQNAGKTSLLRVLTVSVVSPRGLDRGCRLTNLVQGGEFVIEYVLPLHNPDPPFLFPDKCCCSG
jgi:GTPase SAR1 family protein